MTIMRKRNLSTHLLLIFLTWTTCAAGGKELSPVQIKPYGSWDSPISEDQLVEGRVSFGQPTIDGTSIYWLESRPDQGGRTTICRRGPEGKITDLLSKSYSARSAVHEYGGGSYLVSEGTVYFTNFKDQRIWRIGAKGPKPLTAEGTQRFANYVMDPPRQRLIGIRENHIGSGQPVNELVAISLADGQVQVLASGYDFYAMPSLDATQQQIAWLCWSHPNMPWDHTEIWRARFAPDGSLMDSQRVAGEGDESAIQPEWAEDGSLYFVSDRDEWWNLYVQREGKVTACCPKKAEFGAPLWNLGMSTYGIGSYHRLLSLYTQAGHWYLGGLDAKTHALTPYNLPYSTLSGLRVSGDRAVFMGAAPNLGSELVLFNMNSGQCEVIRKSSQNAPDPAVTSIPEAVTFPTEGGQQAYGFYYPPRNSGFQAPEGSTPPLITIVHGGPTGATDSGFDIGIQYWTSRGYAVFDLNHRGSTGYGRSFRNALRGQWGVVDLEDAKNGALYLVSQGKADGEKLIIRGGSAGGYTALAALTFHDVFKAGASYYGISDLSSLAKETHKFESRYTDQVIGAWPAEKATYRARSPLFHLKGLKRPVILFQGLDDKVVPPNQSEMIFEALKKRGVAVAYLPFKGEGHGFRNPENIKRAYRAERYFYAKVFGFEVGDLPAIEIFNF